MFFPITVVIFIASYLFICYYLFNLHKILTCIFMQKYYSLVTNMRFPI